MYLVLLIVRQQLETDIERLTSDRADLLLRIQCYEKDLKAANECKNWVFQITNTIYYQFSVDNEGESYFRYDGCCTQED